MGVGGIEAADAGEAVGDVGLRLVRHLDDRLLPRRGARDARHLALGLSGRVPSLERLRHPRHGIGGAHVADDHDKQRRRRKAGRVIRREMFTPEPLDALDRALRRSAVRVRRGVQQCLERLARADSRIVHVLPDRRQRLVTALLDFVGRKDGIARDVGHDSDHVAEILGEARARQRDDMTVGRGPQRHTPIVERLRDRVRRPGRRPPVNHARKKEREPGEIVGLVEAARAERHRDRHRRRKRRLLDDDDDAARQDVAHGRQAARPGRHGWCSRGRNHPTVRLSLESRRAATSATCAGVTARTRDVSASK